MTSITERNRELLAQIYKSLGETNWEPLKPMPWPNTDREIFEVMGLATMMTSERTDIAKDSEKAFTTDTVTTTYNIGFSRRFVETFEGIDIMLDEDRTGFEYYGTTQNRISEDQGKRLDDRLKQLTEAHDPGVTARYHDAYRRHIATSMAETGNIGKGNKL